MQRPGDWIAPIVKRSSRTCALRQRQGELRRAIFRAHPRVSDVLHVGRDSSSNSAALSWDMNMDSAVSAPTANLNDDLFNRVQRRLHRTAFDLFNCGAAQSQDCASNRIVYPSLLTFVPEASAVLYSRRQRRAVHFRCAQATGVASRPHGCMRVHLGRTNAHQASLHGLRCLHATRILTIFDVRSPVNTVAIKKAAFNNALGRLGFAYESCFTRVHELRFNVCIGRPCVWSLARMSSNAGYMK